MINEKFKIHGNLRMYLGVLENINITLTNFVKKYLDDPLK